jgi:hypothetical protein
MSKRNMDRSEQLADTYLRSLGYLNPEFEPDGNVPPDFLVEKRIAVEVRRLNQNFVSASGSEGLEEVFIPIWEAAHKYLPTLGPSINGESWFVSFTLYRPVEKWRVLKPLVRSALQQFMHSASRRSGSIQIARNFKVGLHLAGGTHPSFFLLGSAIDFDAGGFLIAEAYKNLMHCIAEKEQKVAAYRDKYPEWWLVLPDYICGRLDAENRRQLDGLALSKGLWSKVILINPANPSEAFEV